MEETNTAPEPNPQAPANDRKREPKKRRDAPRDKPKIEWTTIAVFTSDFPDGRGLFPAVRVSVAKVGFRERTKLLVSYSPGFAKARDDSGEGFMPTSNIRDSEILVITELLKRAAAEAKVPINNLEKELRNEVTQNMRVAAGQNKERGPKKEKLRGSSRW